MPRSLLALVPLLCLGLPAFAGQDITWWDQSRHGANWFNETPRQQWLDDAAAAGIHLVRLAPTKWKGEGRDFLLGNADEFTGIPAGDLQKLRQTLDWAQACGIKVVIAPLSLPGDRWSQQNGDKVDDRLWKDLRYHQQSAAFWKELAGALKDHPAIVGYNLINEPPPERALGLRDESEEGLARFHREHAGSAADVNRLYGTIIAAIREVDPRTPIILDSASYAAIDGLPYLHPVADPAVIYSVHFYEPWYFTTYRKHEGKLRYGTEMTIYGQTFVLDKGWIERKFQSVARWSEQNHVPASRIFIGEFGCGRQVPGADEYLRDVLGAIKSRGWHWAFYAYREDGWEGLDYELGAGKVPARYWQLEGDVREAYVRTLRAPNPIWNVIAAEFGTGK